MTIGPPSVSRIRTSTSRKPPPSFTSDSLHLRDHQRAGDGCRETCIVSLACGIADRSNHRRLFRRHRDQHVLAIDLHVGRDADRHIHGGDDVFDHLVRERRRQIAHVGEMRRGRFIEAREGGHEIEPLLRRFAVKSGDPRRAVRAMPGSSHSSASPEPRFLLRGFSAAETVW
jgi:hypothetical protein